ncbi:MAG: hypothetical protein AAF761_06625, partial [Pseudomonadota bacterium]
AAMERLRAGSHTYLSKEWKMADPIKLDITGFYYETLIDDYDPATATVRSITEAAKGRPGGSAGSDGVLQEVTFSEKGSLAKISVEFENAPTSRQLKDGKPLPPMLPSGTYEYEDNIPNGVGDGVVKFSLAWQYYVFAGDRLLSNQPAPGDTRRIVVKAGDAKISDFKETPTKIVWRLVAIGGLPECYKGMCEQASEELLVDLNTKIKEGRITSLEAIGWLTSKL